MTAPRVLNKRHNNQAQGAYVGRPSAFGNPFEIGHDGTREEVVVKYEAWLATRPDLIAEAKRLLRGRNLVCWCAPAACHADVLLRIANEGDE